MGRHRCEAFHNDLVSSCAVAQQHLTYSTTQAKIAFVMSLLSGQAAAWSVAAPSFTHRLHLEITRSHLLRPGATTTTSRRTYAVGKDTAHASGETTPYVGPDVSLLCSAGTLCYREGRIHQLLEGLISFPFHAQSPSSRYDLSP